MTKANPNKTLAAMVQAAIFELEERIDNAMDLVHLLEQKIATDFNLIESLLAERLSIDEEDEQYDTLCLLISRLENEREADIANLVDKKIKHASWSYELNRLQAQLDDTIKSENLNQTD